MYYVARFQAAPYHDNNYAERRPYRSNSVVLRLALPYCWQCEVLHIETCCWKGTCPATCPRQSLTQPPNLKAQKIPVPKKLSFGSPPVRMQPESDTCQLQWRVELCRASHTTFQPCSDHRRECEGRKEDPLRRIHHRQAQIRCQRVLTTPFEQSTSAFQDLSMSHRNKVPLAEGRGSLPKVASSLLAQ